VTQQTFEFESARVLGQLFLNDVRNRTGTAIPQARTFLTARLATQAQAMARRHRELSGRYGPKVTMVSIVQRLGSPPSPELRERVGVELESLKKQSIGDFVVLRAKGLGAIIARSFLATVALLRGGGLVPMRVLKTAFEAGEEARQLPGQLPEIANDLLLGEALEAFAALPPP